jgi:hypothetical protein
VGIKVKSLIFVSVQGAVQGDREKFPRELSEEKKKWIIER